MRLVVIAPGTTGVQQFIDVAWPGGEVFVDEGAEFKAALWEHAGAGKVNNLWLCKPKVLSHMLKVAKLYGHDEEDTKQPSASLLGGELLLGRRVSDNNSVGGGGDGGTVHFEFHENSEFGHAPLETLLAAARKAAAVGPYMASDGR